MSIADEIIQIEQLRADLVQQRGRNMKLLDHRVRGKPLPKGTARLLSNQIYMFNRQIGMYDRQIQRLREWQGT